MQESIFFSELLIILVTATFVAMAFQRLRLPAILGFLLSGALIGPHGFGIISNIENIHNLAEIGMIFLMLTIGLEFSFEKIRGFRRVAFFGGFAQISLSILLSIGFAEFLGWSVYQGFVLGSVIALSSTALVFKYLLDRGELDTQHGRIAVAFLIFQDIAVAPLLIFILAFGRVVTEPLIWTLTESFLKAGFLLASIFVFSRYALTGMLRWISLSRSRETFILFTVIICLGSGWLGSRLGLSAAIGAFFAGMMLANTDYSHQITGEIASFRHIFISIFFISIGLLFNLGFFFTNLPIILLVVALVLFVNFFVVAAVILLFGYPPRIAFATGLILAQIGEFSFLLLETSRESGILADFFYQIILSSAVVTIFMTPLLFKFVPALMRFSDKIPFFGMPPFMNKVEGDKLAILEDHLILCGYGKAGRDLASALKQEKIPFIILEMNAANMRAARSDGHLVLYGDAANREVLTKAGLERAKAFVVSFGDSTSIAEIVRTAQQINSKAMLFIRTRFERDVAWLYELGADVVVMEELEVSLELTRVTLETFGVNKNQIIDYINRIRARKELLVEMNIFKRIK